MRAVTSVHEAHTVRDGARGMRSMARVGWPALLLLLMVLGTGTVGAQNYYPPVYGPEGPPGITPEKVYATGTLEARCGDVPMPVHLDLEVWTVGAAGGHPEATVLFTLPHCHYNVTQGYYLDEEETEEIPATFSGGPEGTVTLPVFGTLTFNLGGNVLEGDLSFSSEVVTGGHAELTTTNPDAWYPWYEQPTTTLAPPTTIEVPGDEAPNETTPLEGEGEEVGAVYPLEETVDMSAYGSGVFPATQRRGENGQWEDLGTFGLRGHEHRMPLKVGDRLVAGPNGASFSVGLPHQNVFLRADTRAVVVLSPGTQIRVVRTPSTWQRLLGQDVAVEGMLVVEAGTVQVYEKPAYSPAEPLPGEELAGAANRTTWGLADYYIAQPNDTTFSVSVDEEGAVLRVFEGQVLVGSGSDSPAAMAVEEGYEIGGDGGQLGTPQAFDTAAAQQEWDALLPLALMKVALEVSAEGSVAVGIGAVVVAGVAAAALALAWGLRRAAPRTAGE